MAQEDRNRLVEWFGILRDRAPLMKDRVADWVADARQEPALVWETPAVRYTAYVLGGLMLLWVASGLAGSIAPIPTNAEPQATSADFHVVCSDKWCGQHFVINRRFGFSKFPVPCAKCGKRTGVRSRRCHSQTCDGRWVAPLTTDDGLRCPQCGGRFE